MPEAPKAKTFDIRCYDPKPDDIFIVDTNAWYWITYTRATLPCLPPPLTKQYEQYARFLKKALDAGTTVARCDLTLAELAHRIEAAEKKIYEYHTPGNANITLKSYRALPNERARVVAEVESAWSQVLTMSEHCALTLSKDVTKAALSDFKEHLIDGYDLFLLQAMKHGKYPGILTDDGDFFGIPDVSVFTCNESSLRKARTAGQLHR
ncbi:MAG TPA: hypothetical protein VFK06_08805 [Candidatus Angelobacter sp.]|nr:hypothetical protein [Candidatus Angelobacter sp.]